MECSGQIVGEKGTEAVRGAGMIEGAVDPAGDTRVAQVIEMIVERRRQTPARRALLVALSGIDASGKSYLAARCLEAARGARAAGLHCVGLSVDEWLNLPSVRFARTNPAENFYRNAIRFDEMFARLVLPLRDQRSVHVEAEALQETATAFHRRLYDYRLVDVILLEGIFLLKREFRCHYDLSTWIDCPFETALRRAIARAQEGLSPEKTAEAYRSIFFPAQKIHLGRDDPRHAATLLL